MKSLLITLTLLASAMGSLRAAQPALANYDDMNTKRLVTAACKGDPAALQKFCSLSQKVILDGASSEAYSMDLGKIADRAGDQKLANTLKDLHLRKKTRAELWNCLSFSHSQLTEADLKKRFPQTSLVLNQLFPL